MIESLRVEIERIEVRIKAYKDWVADQMRYREQQVGECSVNKTKNFRLCLFFPVKYES